MKLKSKYRYSAILLSQLVKSDFKLRYQGSFLGYLWSLLRPLAVFFILYVVFVRFLKIGAQVPHFPVYLLLGIVLWNFFIEVTTGSVSAVVAKGDLIRKINFPKYTIIISGSASALINLCINLVVVGGFMVFTGSDSSMSAVFFPLLIAELLMVSAGLAFLLSALFVKLRDIGYVWEVFIQGAFYATPILYPLDAPIPLPAQKLLILNPVAQVIQDMRHILITQDARTIEAIFGNSYMRLVPILIAVVIFSVGAIYFRATSKNFAENV
jgi:ABC-2 type transport system permease protein